MKTTAAIVILLFANLAAAAPDPGKHGMQCQTYEGAGANVSTEADGVHVKLTARLVNHHGENKLEITGKGKSIQGDAELVLVFPTSACTSRAGGLLSCKSDTLKATLTGKDDKGTRVSIPVTKPSFGVHRVEVFTADSADPQVTYELGAWWQGAAGDDSWTHTYLKSNCQLK